MRSLSLQWQFSRQLLRASNRPCSSKFYSRSVLALFSSRRYLANIKDTKDDRFWYSSPGPANATGPGGQKDYKPNDERKLQLGKTVRILHDRLPSLLASPLPQEIMSPQITLRLFPSTHPHLPSVSGRIAYTAALWTSPVAWGRMPVLGNVKLIIVSERMSQTGSSGQTSENSEKLIVRWKTCAKTKVEVTEQIKKALGRGRSISGQAGKAEDFHGLFIFEFDDKGRIASHIIEHVEEDSNFEKTARFISVTDWLLGRAWGGKQPDGVPGLAFSDFRSKRVAGEKCRE